MVNGYPEFLNHLNQKQNKFLQGTACLHLGIPIRKAQTFCPQCIGARGAAPEEENKG